jgi:Protein of unknown function (DUF4238)
MATNKNQHFVPRCYLRPFTINGEDAAINLYNIDRQKFIANAPVKNQCSGSYFYGQDDELEKAIQSLESGYGAVLREVCKPSYVLIDSHKDLLRKFWLFQYLRTEAAAKRVEMMSLDMTETVGLDANFNLKINDAIQIAMRLFADEMNILDDLKICLIRNKTKIPFITSDDPAVITNRWWLNDNRTQGRSFGLSSAGNITLLPITPKLLCVGYDGDVYSVSHNLGMVDVRDERDILSFNQQQILNCRANLFVQDSNHSQTIHNAYMEIKESRPSSRHKINYAIRDTSVGNEVIYRVVDSKELESHSEALIHSQTVHPKPPSWPKQIIFRNKGTVYTSGTSMVYVRHSAILRDTEISFYKERAN